MKTLKMARFQIHQTLFSIMVYYAIFLTVITLIAVANQSSPDTNIGSSGIELSSAIFLFVAGLNSFKSNFRFSQANHIARKTFFKGIIISIVPIILAMSVLDVIINRIFNLFVPCPTNFDMIYGSYRDTGMWDWNNHAIAWSQNNELPVLFETVLWQFAAYGVVFLIGLLITLVYYRSNKMMKVVVSVAPAIIVTLFLNLFTLLPTSFQNRVAELIPAAFGWQSRNPYIAVFTFVILGALVTGGIYLLVRKAVVKG